MKERPGRNDPCHCASGRKYKKCHWPEEMKQEAQQAKRETAGGPHVTRPDAGIMASRRITDPDLVERANAVLDLLAEKGIEPLPADERFGQRDAFEAACRDRWRALAPSDPKLETAREALAAAEDEDRFEHEFGRDGAKERTAAFADELATLAAAGEDGVPHLAIALMSPSWASNLAVETLTKMPAGPLRDRAVVEGLFVEGDWVPEACLRVVQDWDASHAADVLTGVARRAAADDIELPSTYWRHLVAPDPPHDERWVPYDPAFVAAVGTLLEHGHADAVGSLFEMMLDPWMYEQETIQAFLDDATVQEAVDLIRASPPMRRASDRNADPLDVPS